MILLKGRSLPAIAGPPSFHWPNLRFIVCSDRFNLPDVLHDLFLNTIIHGDDILQASNWELQKLWMDKYPCVLASYLVLL